MKNPTPPAIVCSLALLAGLGVVLSCGAANREPKKPASTPVVSTNLDAIPVSVFVFDPKKSRDPFYPGWRPLSQVRQSTNQTAAPAPVALELNLTGISGSGSRRFAIINNRSMTSGEEADFKTSSGSTIRVRCAEIRDQSIVVVLGGSERKILTLGK
jgi:hypothetical protein